MAFFEVKKKQEMGPPSLGASYRATQFIVQLLQIRVDRQAVEQGRAKVAELLHQ